MNDIEVQDGLIEQFKLGQLVPDEVTTTIAAYNGSTIQLSADPGGSVNAWAGAIIEFTSGDAIGKKAVISSSNGAVIRIADPLNKARLPDPGDSVRLYGGPLKAARVYKFLPPSIKRDVDAGKKYFIFVMPLSGDVETKAMRSGRNDTQLPKDVFIGFEVVVGVPDITGSSTSADALRAIEELPIFKEQIIFMVNWYKAQEENRVISEGPISWGYLNMDIIGLDRVMLKGCTINFDLRIV